MEEKVTVFNGLPNTVDPKTPYSPYNDKTFIFKTISVKSNFELMSVISKFYILNIPLSNLTEPIKTYRRKADLEQYYHSCITYIVLDIDNVQTEQAKDTIVEFFSEYKCILCESRSYNSVSNFNLKGVLFTECIPFNDAKFLIENLAFLLKDYCKIDKASVRKVSLNAPIQKLKIVLNNEDAPRYQFTKDYNKIEQITSEYETSTSTNTSIDVSKDLSGSTIEELCINVFKSMGFEPMQKGSNGAIKFKHPSEVKTKGDYFWFENSPYTMHHPVTSKSVNIYDAIRKSDQGKELLKKEVNYDDSLLHFETRTRVKHVNEKYLSVHGKEDIISEFLGTGDGLFSIKSPMGTGKSTIIAYIIEQAHEQDMKVLIVTNRISVANDFGIKYDMKVYNKDIYNIGDSLICQFDSLWKYNMRNFDLIIMDEFISIMIHSRSNLSNASMNIVKFLSVFNKKIVLADAFLTGYENFLIDSGKTDLFMIDNEYRDPTILYEYENKNAFIDSMLYHASKYKITISGTSLSFLESTRSILEKKGIKTVLLTADTPESTKNLIYGLFELEEHDKWDVLLFSPTLTVGVSNLNKVYHHFHYDSSSSSDVISSLQMIKRTRKAKEIHIFVDEKIKYIKTTYNDLRDEYITNIGRSANDNYMFEIDNYGETRLSEIGRKCLKIDVFKNILEFDHKKAFFWLSKYHFLNEPRIINTKKEHNPLINIGKQIRNDKKHQQRSKINEFLQLNEVEKTNIILSSDADKIERSLAIIDMHIKDCPNNIKQKMLEYALDDSLFISKCRYYKAAFNFTKNIWDIDDLKSEISKSLLNKQNDDISFYNTLLTYGQNEIHDVYIPKTIEQNKRLKFILDKCGYKIRNTSIGMREYSVDKQVKELYGWVK